MRAHLSILVVVLLAGMTVVLGRRAQERLRHQERPVVAALPALPFLEAVALGYREAAADLAWMQAVQYYGQHRQGGNDLSEFGHYLAAVNTLDPHFEHAYVLGAVVLATDGGNLEAALDVLRRGARANPGAGSTIFEMGFLSYVIGNDAAAASRYFALAAQDPRQAERARRFQAFLARRLGQLETSYLLWKDLSEHTDSDKLRIVARESMRHIEAELRARGLEVP
jgi:hypothetical protein